MKYLVAIKPNGMVSFISKYYGGKWLLHNQWLWILSWLESGEELMAIKSFQGLKLTQQNTILIIYQCLHNVKCTESEVLEAYKL